MTRVLDATWCEPNWGTDMLPKHSANQLLKRSRGLRRGMSYSKAEVNIYLKYGTQKAQYVSAGRKNRTFRVVAKAQNQNETEKVKQIDDEINDVDTYGFFNLERYGDPLEAPWGTKDSVLGMLGWGASFVLVGLAFLPIAKAVAGPEGFLGLSQQDKSLFALANQVVETAVGIGIITTSAGCFYNSGSSTVLKLDARNPFRKPDGWAFWGLTGIFISPAVVFAASAAWQAVGADDLQARGTADAISQILSLDGVTFASLFITTAILAPLLEETVFRGFLLPSLAKVMPTPVAVLLSSVAFGLVHLSPRDTPQLTALGILLGFSYVRSRNLLTPMMIHGTWNGTVLTILYILQASGVNLEDVLHGKM